MSEDRSPARPGLGGSTVVGPRASRMRDRRSRGLRGPFSLPGPLSPHRVPIDRARREVFDAVVAEAVGALREGLRTRLPDVTIVVEEAPLLPPDFTDPIPVVAALPRDADHTQVVVFRRPLTERAESAADLPIVVWEALVGQLALVWDCPVEEVDGPPRER